MPGWRPDCFRGSIHEPESVRYRGAENGIQSPDSNAETSGHTVVELLKKDGFGLGLIIAGGVDKGCKAQISSLRPGGLAYRSDSLSVGDYIVSVNGIKTATMKHDEIINLLRNAGEQVLLEIEYQLPDHSFSDSFSVCCKQQSVTLDRDGSSFGFTLRGGYHQTHIQSRPLTVTHIRPGGPADREGSIKVGDRIIAINDYNVAHFTLSETSMLLQQCDQQVVFTVEYDVSVMDAVRNATGPLLVEIDKLPGATLGIALAQTSHQGKWCLYVDNMQPMSIADRCGALHIGDHIMSIDGATVEHMSVAEATQLLRSSTEDTVKLEILPVKIVQQQNSRDILSRNGLFQGPAHSTMVSAASFPAIPSSFSTLTGFGNHSTMGSAMSSMNFGSSTLRMSGRKRNMLRVDKKPSSCMSISSAATSVVVSNQICHSETATINLKGDYRGLGISLDGGMEEHPTVSQIQPGSATERCGLIQEGDRILMVNGHDVGDKTLDEVQQLLRKNRHSCQLEVEFDVTESVMPSSGTFIVKLPLHSGGLGISISGPVKDKSSDPLMISGVERGSIAYRCGSILPGDKLLAINDIRTDNLSLEDAENILQSWDDIVKLKLKREDPYADENGEECVTYTVELQRHGGPLGITISGTDNPSDLIIISDIIEGGLAEKTAAIHIGDRLLAINGSTTRGRTLTDAIHMLQNAGDVVTLRIARPAETNKSKSKKPQSCDRSTTPVASVDSAMESWDSSCPDAIVSGTTALTVGRPIRKSKTGYQSQDSANFASDTNGHRNGISEINQSDSDWDSSSSHSNSDHEGTGDWLKTFKDYENQSEMLKQIGASLRQKGTTSLDRRSRSSERKLKTAKKLTQCTNKDFSSDNQLSNVGTKHRKPPTGLKSDKYQDHVKTIFSPTPLQLHKVRLVKESSEDFGFGLSDGMYEKGVYISGVRQQSPADKAGLKQFDKILQVNGRKTRDFDCCLTIPLITEAGNNLDLIICRNPIAKDNNNTKPTPKITGSRSFRENRSCDSDTPYMNVSPLLKGVTDTPKSI